MLGVNVQTVRLGGGFSFLAALIRSCISVSVYVVVVGEGMVAAGYGVWCWRRAVIRSICFFCIFMNC